MKKIKRVVSLMLMVFLLASSAMSVLAEETVPPTEDEGVVEVGEYLDAETPEKILEHFELEKVPADNIGGYAYEKDGIYIEWNSDAKAENGMFPISCFVEGNSDISYYGITCGSTKKQVDRVLKEHGWKPWGSRAEGAFYLKDENGRAYAFDIELSDGEVQRWDWLNWRQGNFGNVPYDDVPANQWYFDAVRYVNGNWLMTGLENRVFGPAQNLARAQFAVILHRMNEEPTVDYTEEFPDVGDGVWYTDAILWANSIGVVTGYEDTGNFGPADDINREQMATMMYRYAQFKGYDTSQKEDFGKFSDAVYVNAFAQDAMQWAVGTGIIQGKDNGTRIDPQGNANRAECATIIMRFIEEYGQ